MCHRGSMAGESTLAAVLVGSAALAGCSVPEVHSVSREQVQDQIVEKVTEQSGTAPDSVSCPGDLAASVGASVDCLLAADGQRRRVSVTVDAAEGDQVALRIEQSIAAAAVTEQITEQVAKQIGRAPDQVSCPGDLSAADGATLRCQLKDSGKTYGVTVTTVDRGRVTFDIRVDEQPQ